MVGMQERRREIAEILYYADDYVKMKPLAVRFGVSYKTIRNDVDALSMCYHIISRSGHNGGVKLYVQRKKLRFLDFGETAALMRIMQKIPPCEQIYIKSIVRDLALVDLDNE